jgi:small-conductance mechanosensitive channel
MNFLQSTIPLFIIFEYIIVGLLLLLVLNFIGRYIIPLIEKRTVFINPWWQKIQIVIWLAYLILFYSDLLRLYTAITLISTVVVLGLGWEYWKNIFAGVLIKFNDQFKKGDFISINKIKGTLKTIRLSRSELINEKGELVVIPNNELRNKVLTHLHRTQDVNICIFNVKNTIDQSPEAIYKLAYDCPYISGNQEISVEKKQKNEYIIKATIIDNSFIEYANNYFETASDLQN